VIWFGGENQETEIRPGILEFGNQIIDIENDDRNNLLQQCPINK